MGEVTHVLVKTDAGPKKMARVKVGQESTLYYGDGTEPCHYCDAKVGKPHKFDSMCDHEECPNCGGQLLMGCECEIAEFYSTIKGTCCGSRLTSVGIGFTEDEAYTDAERGYAKKKKAALKRYIKRNIALRGDLERNLARLDGIKGLATPAIIKGKLERVADNIARAEAMIAE